ncbi:spermidine synthase [Bradyrhizobium sp. LM2.7]
MVHIARDPTLFRFLSTCGPDMRVVLGDARLSLAASSDRYDLIVLDAFSSDLIPVRLLTRRAKRSCKQRQRSQELQLNEAVQAIRSTR